MQILQQLTVSLLTATSSLAFVTHGMPQFGSDDQSLIKRDDTSNSVVYPKDFANKTQATAIGNLLKALVSDPKSISVHGGNLGIAFWGVPLTSAEAQKVEADPNVRI